VRRDRRRDTNVNCVTDGGGQIELQSGLVLNHGSVLRSMGYVSEGWTLQQDRSCRQEESERNRPQTAAILSIETSAR
jgi:hypothetical protein